jgi:glycosyltransferase involved in cell wall biosynthesis
VRILIVTQYFWPENFRINDLARGMVERGHEVTVLTGQPNYPQGRIYPGYHAFSTHDEFSGIPIRRVPLIARGKARGLRLAANYSSFAVMATVLGPLRCRGPFDVLFAFEPSPITVGIPAAALRRWYGVPLLFWVLDLWPDSLVATGAVRSPWVLKSVDRLVRSIYAHCDRVLVQSRRFIPHVQQRGVGADRISYFPSWAEEVYQPIELPADAFERRDLPPGFRILFAGNVGVSQSFETILDAAERTRSLPDLRWVIIGEGRQRCWLQQQIRTRNLSETVSWLGARPVENMPRYFAAADALLVTLKRDPIFSLTIPGKLQSYLACQKPILAALDGEGAAIVDESGAGHAGPSEDGQTLAEHAVALYRASPVQRAAMGLRGRAYFEQNFQRRRLLDRLETLFQETIAQRGRPALLRRGA